MFAALEVQFTNVRYSGTERNGIIVADLELIGGTSTIPFDVIVTPSQQSPPSAIGDDVECHIV